MAQQASLAVLRPEAMEPAPFVQPAGPMILPEARNHRFWDRKNSFLFATTAALSTADFLATRDNLRNGGRELEPGHARFRHGLCRPGSKLCRRNYRRDRSRLPIP